MIKSELLSIIKSKRGKFIIALIMIIPMLDLFLNWYSDFSDYYRSKTAYVNGISYENILNPAKAAFLSGTSHTHIPQILLIWILPIFLLILYCDKPIIEKKMGYFNIIYCKCSKKCIMRIRFLISFLIPFCLAFVSLLTNFLLALILFSGGKNFCGMDNFSEKNVLLKFSINNPNITYIIYIVIFSILAGLCGMTCLGVSLLVNNYKYVYLTCLVIWFLQIPYEFSITYAMQPFIEYGLDKIIPGLCINIFISVVVVAIASYLVKGRDEI